MLKGQLDFYNERYQGQDYAVGAEERKETAALRDFVESYGLEAKHVLEIGCGRGAFQGLVRKWFGVDLALSVATFVGKPFVSASAEALPFRKESFDAIWSVYVLEHVAHPERALLEIVRVLKPGGIAYLAPAWHCRPWAAEGYPVRPWSDFDWRGKLIKASIPLRDALWFRGAYTLPVRMYREILFQLPLRRPWSLRYRRLEPNYTTYWCTDSDACSAMDPHEMLLWFQSRGWRTPSHRNWWRRLLVRSGAIIVQKRWGEGQNSHGI